MRWTDLFRSVLVVAALAGPAAGQPAPPAPSPLSLLDVPFISQSEALCGGAAAAMVLRYWGERGIDAESFAHLVDRSAAGIRTTSLIRELRGRGWNATALDGSPPRMAAELDRGRPVLTLIEDRPGTYHYIVVVAATEQAVVFHDPARAPLRVMRRGEFERRWDAADRWMAIVVPGAAPEESSRAAAPAVPVSTPCEALIAEGIARAQVTDLAAAERTLTAALGCPGPAALRELAGVRLLQRRWPDVAELASAALALDPRDEHSWRLLGTSRFVQNDPAGALGAWNHIGEPRVDLVSVAGLTRTRQRQVETLVGVHAGDVLTPEAFLRARRRLDELPSASSTRLEFVPVPSGLAEVRATVNERPVFLSDVWSYAAVGLKAAAAREIELSTSSLVESGERLTGAWRFWPHRRRVALGFDSPAPWGGVWSVEASSTRETFDRPDIAAADRVEGRVSVFNWLGAVTKVGMRVGATRWERTGRYATVGGGVRLLSPGELMQADAGFDVWAGDGAFSRATVDVRLRSSATRRGRVWTARAGAGTALGNLPMDLWFAGDTGHTRDVLLRAHPVLEDGRLQTGRLRRRIVHASLEAQHWWRAAAAGIAAAGFVDAAGGDVDAGAGVRVAFPGIRGIFRADVARGLRDGAAAFSFVYQPSGW